MKNVVSQSGIKYYELNSTFFHKHTNIEIANVLISAQQKRNRIRIWLGDTITGKSWNEENDTCGYVGRSTGDIKIPILVNKLSSSGGCAILTHKILKIVDTRTKRVLYQHSKFNQSYFTVSESIDGKGEVYSDRVLYARCKNLTSAQRLADFMNDNRMSK